MDGLIVLLAFLHQDLLDKSEEEGTRERRDSLQKSTKTKKAHLYLSQFTTQKKYSEELKYIYSQKYWDRGERGIKIKQLRGAQWIQAW